MPSSTPRDAPPNGSGLASEMCLRGQWKHRRAAASGKSEPISKSQGRTPEATQSRTTLSRPGQARIILHHLEYPVLWGTQCGGGSSPSLAIARFMKSEGPSRKRIQYMSFQTLPRACCSEALMFVLPAATQPPNLTHHGLEHHRHGTHPLAADPRGEDLAPRSCRLVEDPRHQKRRPFRTAYQGKRACHTTQSGQQQQLTSCRPPTAPMAPAARAT